MWTVAKAIHHDVARRFFCRNTPTNNGFQLDYIALVLILLQLILLVRIARALEGLNPAKIAEAIKASRK